MHKDREQKLERPYTGFWIASFIKDNVAKFNNELSMLLPVKFSMLSAKQRGEIHQWIEQQQNQINQLWVLLETYSLSQSSQPQFFYPGEISLLMLGKEHLKLQNSILAQYRQLYLVNWQSLSPDKKPAAPATPIATLPANPNELIKLGYSTAAITQIIENPASEEITQTIIKYHRWLTEHRFTPADILTMALPRGRYQAFNLLRTLTIEKLRAIGFTDNKDIQKFMTKNWKAEGLILLTKYADSLIDSKISLDDIWCALRVRGDKAPQLERAIRKAKAALKTTVGSYVGSFLNTQPVLSPGSFFGGHADSKISPFC